MNSLIEYTVAGNPLWRWMVLSVVILLSLFAGQIAKFWLQKRGRSLAETRRLNALGMILGILSRPLVFLLLLLGFRLGLLFVLMTPAVESALDAVLRILTAATIGYFVYSLVDVADYYITSWANRTRNKIDNMLAPLIRKSLRITVVIAVGLYVVESLTDKPITTLVAGLGIGGLAIALAGQDTIKNFFGSLVIIADKPFHLGDRVVIGEHTGKVEAVGFRSTKIRTLAGHLVVIPNGEVAARTVENIGRRPFIRRTSNITITYDTTPEKVDEAVNIIREILHDHQGMSPDYPPRVFFNEFNDASLNIVMSYWFHPPDYWEHLAFSQEVNREILRRFNDAGIEFAFPTQTIFLASDPKRGLTLTENTVSSRKGDR